MLKEGRVVAHLGQGIAVETDATFVLCQPLRKLETIAVGDQVLWSPVSADQGRIEQILPRRSLLTRPSRNAKIRPVAANIDTVYVVVATEPECDLLLVDQYLAVCENSGIEAGIVVNKTDLPASETIEQELLTYQHLGYPVYRISTLTGTGLADFQAVLRNKTSLLAGQSGVGKSSISNVLLPDKNLKTNAISAASKLGRHTTTAATLYAFPGGGALIDSPGVSIFGLADMDRRQLCQGYRELAELAEKCLFNDCCHELDKGCAVREAAETSEQINARYRRFLKLTAKMPKPHPAANKPPSSSAKRPSSRKMLWETD